MSNEILRVSNKERIADAEISVSSYGAKNKRSKINSKENSFYTLLTDELSEKTVASTSVVIPVEKPRLFEPVALAVLLLCCSLALTTLCYFFNELYFIPLLILVASIAVPISLTFFCFRLNTHNDVSFFQVLKFILLGVAMSLIVNMIFSKLSSGMFGASIVASIIHSATDIVFVALIISSIVLQNKSNNYMSVLLIACSISAGYVIADVLINLFFSLFVSFTITDGNLTHAIGAILNDGKYLPSSVENLVISVLRNSVFQPAVFMFASIICGFAIRFISVKNLNGNSNTLTGSLFFPLCIVLYILSEFLSSIAFLQILYNLISLTFAVICFYKVVDYCIKTEKYL